MWTRYLHFAIFATATNENIGTETMAMHTESTRKKITAQLRRPLYQYPSPLPNMNTFQLFKYNEVPQNTVISRSLSFPHYIDADFALAYSKIGKHST